MPEVSARRLQLKSLGAFLLAAAALLLGGGGAEGSNFNALIAAAGAFALVAVLVRTPAEEDLRFSTKRLALAVGLSCLAIPLLQLVPLPPSIWHDLAGRQSVTDTLRLVGAAELWRPLSMAPDATLRTATFLLFPVAAFFAAARGTSSTHRRFLMVLAVCAGLSALLGAAQLALGHPEWLSFYDGPSYGAASGIFANPNHQALFMVFGLVSCAVIIREQSALPPFSRRRPSPNPMVLAAWAGFLLFSVMTLASGARAGIMLLVIALPGSLLIAKGRSSVLRAAGLLLGVVAMLWALVLVYPGTNSLGLRESFRFGEDARYAYLPDILYTLDQYWSAGSGLGSFVPVFTPNESLEVAGRAYLNHAHNDFLEWTLETGLLGVAWLALATLAVGYLAFRRLRSAGPDLGLTLGALLLVTLAALHSLADYPLRTATIATVFAFAAGLLCSKTARPGPAIAEVRLRKARPRWLGMAAFALAIPVAAVALRSHLLHYAIRSGDLATAAKLDPNNSNVLIGLSEAALMNNQHATAERIAARAVVVDPLSAPALRQLALALEGQKKDAEDVWRAASALGWRDGPTQLWAFKQGLLGDQLDIAAMRAGALLRTEKPDPKLLSLIRTAALKPAFASELAARIRMDPPWRSRFFSFVGKPTSGEVSGVTQVLRQLANHKDATRADARSLISHFVGEKQWGKALAMYDLVARPANGSPVLDDGGFDRTEEEYQRNSTAFDWQTLNGSHVSGHIESSPPSRLVLDSDGEAQAAGAQRYVFVNPGKYAISFLSRSDNDDSFQFRISCVNSSMVVASGSIGQSTSFKTQTAGFEVPAGCPLVRLALESLQNGSPATAEFDNFVIERS